MNVLGIETSCDETAAAVVTDGTRVRSNVVSSQVASHRPYGGIVPEIASRRHVEDLPAVVVRALRDAGMDWDEVDALAATCGPGLATSLMIGLSAAKALALRLGKPLRGVNHVEAHLYSLFLGSGAPAPGDVCPLVALMVSGGHTCLVRVDGVGRYRLLGQTMDDAAGEALDKGANLLRLGYPGGPAIEAAARGGDPAFIRFPRGLEQRSPGEMFGGFDRNLCFSFSGLKTSLLYYLRDRPDALGDDRLRHVAASYQEAVFDTLLSRLESALEQEAVRAVGCVGGVARNRRLREKLEALARSSGCRLVLARPEFCTDNAAMVAALAGAAGTNTLPDDGALDVQPDLVLTSA
jgi:N6-L-threonylcarbamoyladenine synthase